MVEQFSIDREAIADFCRKWHVVELSLFGSVLTEAFDPVSSDVDVLVDFAPDARMTLFKMTAMSDELARLVGRQVDLVIKEGLKERIRHDILASAAVIYAAA